MGNVHRGRLASLVHGLLALNGRYSIFGCFVFPELFMTESEFIALAAQGYNRIPMVLETFADLDTPLSVYLKLAGRPYSYLLESVVGGERFGRYSFIGLAAQHRIEVHGKKFSEYHDGKLVQTTEVADPLQHIQNLQQRFTPARLPGLPRFCGGLVGYFGYDTVRYIEAKLAQTTKPDVLDTPDILLLFSEQIAVVDNLTGKLFIVVYADPNEAEAYTRAREQLKMLLAKLRKPVEIPAESPCQGQTARSECGEDAFKAAVERSKRYIYDGDIMQVVLSQRLSQPFSASPLALYRALRALNPSPYMFYFDLGGVHVVGASPEILVRLEQDTVTVRPIAGTRPRGKTSAEDEKLAQELLADPKERAEHIMLMDLGRNDLGRVAQTGTVKVTENMTIENYSHVMHIVSNVEGKLKPGLSAMDVLKATFPAGTVSGAPKVRAMEIIDELEPTKRGIYAGAVGYLGFNGDMDLAIAIRTAVIKNQTLYVQAGAGIVADSVPASEWQETCNKAKAVLRAAEMAQAGLDSKV
jgi:anthranilate synthase component 1